MASSSTLSPFLTMKIRFENYLGCIQYGIYDSELCNVNKIIRIRFSDRINNQCHPWKLRRQPATSPLTLNTPKMSPCSNAKKEVGSNRPKPQRQAADQTAEKLCWGKK
ncbi:hypothetical protein NDU88_007736 [Pleurodeles waltl]|uniref:Uncharacterized protein n=1 Tax=Pleurodeles waltl TaxID=8319 RepID=A0AAV7QSQ6_PLEWA|nr:hypothetical protein NDU88_007736 [Pleurodeles waltl]